MNRQTHSARAKSPWPTRSSSGQDAEIDWERIMVQITLAFVIILGYLVSVGVDEANELATKTESQMRRNDMLQKVLAELKGTEVGKAVAARLVAEKNLQREKLLRIWAEQCAKRLLNGLLRHPDINSEQIPLSDDLCLPTGRVFQELNSETERIFLVAGQDVSTTEIARLAKDVMQLAGFDPEVVPAKLDPNQMSQEVADFYFDERLPSYDNFKYLTQKILSDLRREREQVGKLQYFLVGRIAAARRDKLATLALPEEDEVDVAQEGVDLGLVMLDSVLDDLKSQMKLLPETADRIRKGVRTDPPENSNPK